MKRHQLKKRFSTDYHEEIILQPDPLKQISEAETEEALYKLSCEDFVQKLSAMNKYLTSMELNSTWKVVAAFGMVKEPETTTEIITASTGTKGVDGRKIDTTGTHIIDCHAEIISRRCLKDFFYKNLELFLENKGEESIFMKKQNGGFCLKPHIKFNLYISTAPCGDGRLFCHYLKNNEDDPHPERCNRGLLHVKKLWRQGY